MIDLSTKRINMCTKAKEIQNLWVPKGGDWYIYDYRGTTKLGRSLERKIWGDDDKVWQRVEVLCYQPKETKDFFVSSDGEHSHVTSTKDIVKGNAIWLPMQHQLQDMLEYETVYKLISDFYAFYWSLYTGLLSVMVAFKTYDQLYTAFVMSKKFHKIWDDTKISWIKSI